jgi:hypothetical protein
VSRAILALSLSFLVLGSHGVCADEPFRPGAGKFTPLGMAHAYPGELMFVDHANRRDSIRVQSTGIFRNGAPRLYADFKKGVPALMNGVENTLKHTESGTAGPAQMAARGTLLDVTKMPGDAPLGSSGIQIRFETDLFTEGLRPTRIVRVRPANWPDVHVPREEYLSDGDSSLEERFPTPTIFPKY